jgi:hypothetical protein
MFDAALALDPDAPVASSTQFQRLVAALEDASRNVLNPSKKQGTEHETASSEDRAHLEKAARILLSDGATVERDSSVSRNLLHVRVAGDDETRFMMFVVNGVLYCASRYQVELDGDVLVRVAAAIHRGLHWGRTIVSGGETNVTLEYTHFIGDHFGEFDVLHSLAAAKAQAMGLERELSLVGLGRE